MFDYQLYTSICKSSFAEGEKYRLSFIKAVPVAETVETKEIKKIEDNTDEEELKKELRRRLKDAGVKFYAGATLEQLREKLLEINL